MAFIICNVLCIAVLVGIDQAIKAWAVAVLAPVGSMPLIPHIVELRFVLNEGMAFSMLSGRQTLLIVVTSITIVVLAWYLFRRCRGRLLRQITMLLLVSGGIGNLIDRVLNGRVVDYINLLFMHFAVFNFADICVTVGVVLLVLCILLEGEPEDTTAVDGTKETDR